ncbi:MAG: alpha-galactosidase [Puniceicoccales bacterium]|jgi:hypothetical protein|nr:alpha-galactosidase [Puniceicoccales bacterium]
MMSFSRISPLLGVFTCLVAFAGLAVDAVAEAPLSSEKTPPKNVSGAVSIQNEFYTISFAETKRSSWDRDVAGRFEIVHRPSGKRFVKDFTVVSEGASHASLISDCPVIGNGIYPSPHNRPAEPVKDPVLGDGWGLVCDGRLQGEAMTSVELYPGVPFVIVRTTLRSHHDPRGITDVSKFSPVSFSVDLDKPAGKLKTLGTGGLLAADKNPGSHLFLTAADPVSRNGVVVGWISQNLASGVVFSKITNGKVAILPELHFGHLFLYNNHYKRDGVDVREQSVQSWDRKKVFDRRQLDTARGKVVLDPLVIGYFEDARVGNELYADLIARFNQIKIRPQSAVYCTWYAEKNGHAGSARSTAELAPFIAQNLKDFGMDTLQIDDMWQAGKRYSNPGYPASHFDRVNPKGPYPDGIATTAKVVDKAGLRLGLWWLPFGRHHFEPEYEAKQHWFIHRLDGSPYRTKSFGGTCLDLTHPDVLEHLRTLSREMRRWGVNYYKMDGLWAGLATDTYYINDGFKDDKLGDHLPFYDLGKTNIEAYRQGLQAIRQGAGADVFFSGCNVAQNMRTLGASIGLVDAMRIGPDYNHDGKGFRTGPIRGSRLYFLNGKVWWNDPDPVKVRAKSGGVSLDQARLSTSWVAHSGQFFLISDWLPNLDADRLEVLKRTMTPHKATVRPVDYFENTLPEVWLLTDAQRENAPRRDVLALYNWGKEAKDITANLARAGLDAGQTWHAFDFWAGIPLPDFTKEIKTKLPRESCQIVSLRPAVGHPVLVSTSRHVTQGVVDVREEKWVESGAGESGCLSGVSEVIANDPYELRIAGLGEEWEVKDTVLSGEEPRLEAKCSTPEPGWLRVSVPAPRKTGLVRWRIEFKKRKG